MTAQLRQRVERIRRDLIQTYMDLFIVLLAERGASVQVQQERVEALVVALLGLKIEGSLFVQGRRVPMIVEMEPGPPQIKLNEELLARVEDEELLFAFGKPIAMILELPSVSIGLVLQGRDEKQLRNLYHAAKSRVSEPTIAATSVGSIVEHRLGLFVKRLARLVERLSQGQRVEVGDHRALATSMIGAASWAEWDQVAAHPFMDALVEATNQALQKAAPSQYPPAATLLELCWESLDLSSQSFMRHVGRALRTQGMAVSYDLLAAIARIVEPEPQAAQELETMSHWPSMSELEVAWHALYEQELETLGVYYQGPQGQRHISVFEPVRDSLGLREPVELPFDYPLVCWSVREVAALRDLLQGFVQAHHAARAQPKELELLLCVEPPAGYQYRLSHDQPGVQVELQVIGTTIEVMPGYEQLQARAWLANEANLLSQFHAQPAEKQLSTLKRLRGCYEGFFMHTKPVWERRLQGWELDEPEHAFKRLINGVREILDVPVYLEPFEDPSDEHQRMIPHFCFVVAMSEHVERVPFKVPIQALISTAATGSPPLLVRFINVPGDLSERDCRWLCDRELTMMTMQGHPVQLTLRAVEDNSVRMLAYEP